MSLTPPAARALSLGHLLPRGPAPLLENCCPDGLCPAVERSSPYLQEGEGSPVQQAFCVAHFCMQLLCNGERNRFREDMCHSFLTRLTMSSSVQHLNIHIHPLETATAAPKKKYLGSLSCARLEAGLFTYLQHISQ